MLFLNDFNLAHLIQYISLDGFKSLPFLMTPKDLDGCWVGAMPLGKLRYNVLTVNGVCA